MNKEIEEMARLACTCFDGNCECCAFNFYQPCPPKSSAERIYNAGYRKQRVGEWVEVPNVTTSASGREIHSNLYVCSLCGRSNGRRKQKYCPECGAKMKGERNEV